MEKRKCNKCGETKPLTDFYKAGRKNRPNDRHYECKECTKARVKRNHCPETYRRQHLKRQYGITPEEYDQMLESQQGCCAACKTDQPGNSKHDRYFVVDHCHETGKVRGLLCHQCNTALGLLKDNPETLSNLITYVLRNSSDGAALTHQLFNDNNGSV